MTRLEVWGDPIDHSRSPQLHAAAYRLLGLDWQYGRRQVDERSFARELVLAGQQLRGMSLTMPLKTCAFDAADWRDPRALRTGVANTLLFTERGLHAYNTDVGGLVQAMRSGGIEGASRGRVIGAGATATSALVALSEVGVRDVELVARTPARAMPLLDRVEDLGMRGTVRGFEDGPFAPVEATIATLPGGTELVPEVVSDLADTGGVLVDVVYAPWPTSLATAWQQRGRHAASGLDMLLHQAVLQVRVFVTGQVQEPLSDERSMVDVMRSALVGD